MFAVKFDGRHKARVVADGHLTPEPIENIYSGVVSLRNHRLVIFLCKLNHLDLWGADIGYAYLEAFTDEKLYIVAGPAFQELEGYILIFLKALYGLKSSGKRWTEVIHGILREMKVLPSKADPCIWVRKAPNLRCYEYIAVYVDDLCIAAESPRANIQIVKSKYLLKVKGDGKLTYHLLLTTLKTQMELLLANQRNILISQQIPTEDSSMMIHQKATRPLLTKMITQS